MFVFNLGTMLGQNIFLTSYFLDIVNLHHQISGKKEKTSFIIMFIIGQRLNLEFSCAIYFWFILVVEAESLKRI